MDNVNPQLETQNSQSTVVTIIIWAIIIAALILKLILTATIPPHVDSNYYLNISENFRINGNLTPYMWRLDADTNIIAGSGSGYGVLFLVGWLQLFGLSVIAGRVLMYIIGIATLILLYFISIWLWHDRKVARMVVLFTSLNVMFFYTFSVRMDALGAFSYSLVFGLHLYATYQPKRFLHAIVGVGAILTAEIHIIGLVYVGAFAFYYSIEQIKLWWRQRQLLVSEGSLEFFAGALVTGIAYLVIHVLPNPEAYFVIARSCTICESASLQKEVTRLGEYVAQAPLGTVTFIMSLVWLVRNPTPIRHHLFVWAIGVMIAFAIVSPPVNFQYSQHLYPTFSLIIGLYLSDQMRPMSKLERFIWFPVLGILGALELGIYPNIDNILIIIISSVLLLILLLGVEHTPMRYFTSFAFLVIVLLFAARINDVITSRLRHGSRPMNPVNTEVHEYIETYIPTDATIMGSPTSYIDLLNYPNYLTYKDGDLYGIALRGEDHITFLLRESPDVILGEGAEWNGRDITDDPVLQEYMDASGGFTNVGNDLWVKNTLIDVLAIPTHIP